MPDTSVLQTALSKMLSGLQSRTLSLESTRMPRVYSYVRFSYLFALPEDEPARHQHADTQYVQ
jgi:hypothetical protein